ncbi:DNA-directed RNA polymerase subunit K [Nanoarchaeota archaeon]
MAIDIQIQGRDTKYEKARMIGSRALQISMGAPILVKLTKKNLEKIKYNPVEIAKLEYKEGKMPISVKRVLPHQDGKMY